MVDYSKLARDKAEAKKRERAEKSAKAMAQYQTEILSDREKTARLKALRLANEEQ